MSESNVPGAVVSGAAAHPVIERGVHFVLRDSSHRVLCEGIMPITAGVNINDVQSAISRLNSFSGHSQIDRLGFRFELRDMPVVAPPVAVEEAVAEQETKKPAVTKKKASKKPSKQTGLNLGDDGDTQDISPKKTAPKKKTAAKSKK